MSYYQDLTKRTLDWLKDQLQEKYLLPSQRILLENMEERFAILVSSGITNAEQLRLALKTKKDLTRISSNTGIPENYLTVLRRTVNSYHPKPRMIRDFPDINQLTVDNLQGLGIRTTADIFDSVSTAKRREQICRETGLPPEEILFLAKLTDLTRMRYVNPVFASLLVHSGFDNIEKIMIADAASMYKQIISVNSEMGIYRGKIGEKDIAFLIRESAILPLEMEL